jgi:hypothetical protein
MQFGYKYSSGSKALFFAILRYANRVDKSLVFGSIENLASEKGNIAAMVPGTPARRGSADCAKMSQSPRGCLPEPSHSHFMTRPPVTGNPDRLFLENSIG